MKNGLWPIEKRRLGKVRELVKLADLPLDMERHIGASPNRKQSNHPYYPQRWNRLNEVHDDGSWGACSLDAISSAIFSEVADLGILARASPSFEKTSANYGNPPPQFWARWYSPRQTWATLFRNGIVGIFYARIPRAETPSHDHIGDCRSHSIIERHFDSKTCSEYCWWAEPAITNNLEWRLSLSHRALLLLS